MEGVCPDQQADREVQLRVHSPMSHVFECVPVLVLQWGRRVALHRDKLTTQLGGGVLSAKHRAGAGRCGIFAVQGQIGVNLRVRFCSVVCLQTVAG